MKRLDFVQKRYETPRPTFIEKTRSFFKVTANAALVAGLALMPMVLPKVWAQDTKDTAISQTKTMQLSKGEIDKYLATAEKNKLTLSKRESYAVRLEDSTEVSMAFTTKGEFVPKEEAGNEIVVGVTVKNKPPVKAYVFHLSEFKDSYKKATGEELKYVRVGMELGEDPQVGSYVQFYIFPVKTKGGEVSSGNQKIFICNYATKLTSPGGSNEPVFVAVL